VGLTAVFASSAYIGFALTRLWNECSAGKFAETEKDADRSQIYRKLFYM
jgi:hypothetical protein